MSPCGLCARQEALRARGARPEKRAKLRVDLLGLRRALGGRAELLEGERAAKATGRPKANVGAIWRYFTTSTYESGDLPVIATREALQNGLDAIKAAVAARQIKAGEGRFSVTWDARSRSLTWEDNGVGMDADTILSKFLSLGDSGKKDAQSSDEAAGGFGVAKAVILGVSSTFRWEMHTRNNLAVARGMDADVEIFEEAPRQGTRITVHDIPDENYWLWDHGRQDHVSLPDRLRELLGANDLPGLSLLFDGAPVAPLFSRRGGGRVDVAADWGEGTTARVRAYRRPPGDRSGAWYVRLNGLFQFKRPSARGGLKADMVIDLTTRARPGDPAYPLTAARDQLQKAAGRAFRELATVVERESESAGRSDEEEVFEPEGQGGGALHRGLADLFADPEIQRLLGRSRGTLADFYRSQAQISAAPETIDSVAPPGSPAQRAEGFLEPIALPGLSAGEPVLATDLKQPDAIPIDVVRLFLRNADGAIADAKGDRDHSDAGRQARGVFGPEVELALTHLDQGWGDARTVTVVEQALARAVAEGVEPGALAPLIRVAAVAPPAKASAGNPFGALAGLRISKTNYDRAKARKFRKSAAQWMPYLLAWEGTLRLLAAELGVRRPFKPGFVLDDTLVGLASKSESGPLIISIHPDRFAQVVELHRLRPLAIASFLHHVAVHEFAHADGRLGRGHDEEYVVAREDLGHATGHLLPVIAALVSRLLKLPMPPDSDAARAQRLANDLVTAKARVEALRHELARVKRTLAKVKRDAAGPDAVQTPGTNLYWSTLEQWLDVWDTIRARRTTSKKDWDLSEHLQALPDELVVQASAPALDRLEELLRRFRPRRGARMGHPSTRLLDAVHRARVGAGPKEPSPPSFGHPLLDLTAKVLRRRPPPGLDRSDVDGFFARNRAALLAVAGHALPSAP